MENENMTRNTPKPARNKRVDYITAIIANVIILFVVNQLLNWNIFPFLTQDFDQVLPIQNISLAITIIFNALFLFYNPQWFEALLRMVMNGIGIAVVLSYMNTFPFDFSAYSFNFNVLARVMLFIGLIGCAIAMLVEAINFVRALLRTKQA